ncbi:MAG: hypothetical protein WKF95_01330 [Rubrobacter sp.]
MVRRVAHGAMWVGRVTVFPVGLAVIPALVLGAAFSLGKTNTVNAPCKPACTSANPLPRIDNGTEPAPERRG